jgi:hypothetical protein
VLGVLVTCGELVVGALGVGVALVIGVALVVVGGCRRLEEALQWCLSSSSCLGIARQTPSIHKELLILT